MNNSEEFEASGVEPPALESDLPQTIPLDPGKLIDQLMRRYGGQNQQQVWENAQLATENDALKTLLAEAASEQQGLEATVVQLSLENEKLQGAAVERHWDELSSADDPQEVDAFRAMATAQPGLASAPAPAESSATTPRP